MLIFISVGPIHARIMTKVNTGCPTVFEHRFIIVSCPLSGSVYTD